MIYQRSKYNNWLWVLFTSTLLLSSQVSALTLGEAVIESQYGQPLRAKISIIEYTPEELKRLSAAVVPVSSNKTGGIDQATGRQADLAVNINYTNPPFLSLISVKPIKELVLSIPLELRWSGKKLDRLYDLIIPVTSENQLSVIKAKTANDSKANRLLADYNGKYLQMDGSIQYGPVQPGETLSKIAQKVRPRSNMSIPQVMLTLYEANPHAFMDNINGLKAGVMLTLKRPQLIDNTDKNKARNIAVRHHEEWYLDAPKGSDSTAEDAPSHVASVSEKPLKVPDPIPHSFFRIAETPSNFSQDVVLEKNEPLLDNDVLIVLKEETAIVQESNRVIAESNREISQRLESLERLMAKIATGLIPGREAIAAQVESIGVNPSDTNVEIGPRSKSLNLVLPSLIFVLISLAFVWRKRVIQDR